MIKRFESDLLNAKIDLTLSGSEKIVIYNDELKIDSSGNAAGYISYTIIVTPSLTKDFEIKIKGDFNKHTHILETLHNTYMTILSEEVYNE